jgi:hypothetical protein
MDARSGDRIIVESEAVGQPAREGEILEVIHGETTVRYRVKWTDGHETVFSPGVGSSRIARLGAKQGK